MPYIKIDREKCKGCMLCVELCPKKLLEVDNNINKRGIKPVKFIDGDCTGCQCCAVICPDVAIEVYR